MRRIIIAMLWLAIAFPAMAHEVRPAYLELHELRAGKFQVLWKTPMRGDMRLGLSPEFSGRTEHLTLVVTRDIHNASVETWRMKAIDPLRGQHLRIVGLEATMTDVLVRAEFADGTIWTQRLTPGQTAMRIPARESSLAVAGVYLGLGIEHILTGIDHLLFVLALLIIVGGMREENRGTRVGGRVKKFSLVTRHSSLLMTVTAFTVAHSITLALATLGFVHVPQAPVEAAIALSIVFVASEILRTQGRGTRGEGRGEGRGRRDEGLSVSRPSTLDPRYSSLTSRAPWIVAFTFGLLHGFGFAGALSEVGLPQGDIPLALLFFNVGVEAGQLMFIAAVLSLMAVGRHVRISLPRWAGMMAPYAIGSIAMFWVIQRIALF